MITKRHLEVNAGKEVNCKECLKSIKGKRCVSPDIPCPILVRKALISMPKEDKIKQK